MVNRAGSLRRRFAASAAAAVVIGVLVPLLPAGEARADTAPVPPVTQPTVSADALPTVQIDGVAWAQLVVGGTVYVAGKFTQARPAGAAAGTNQTARTNMLAYDLATGNLISSFAPSLNGQGLGLAASADGTTIYVAGEFTAVNGVTRNRIAAVKATTGALVTTFNPNLNGRARGITVAGSTVYLGGNFTTAGGQARQHLAAVDATTGALRAWAPPTDQEVFGVVAPAGMNEIVAGGRFTTVNGTTAIGSAALDATTGGSLPWAVNQVVQDYGPDAAIYSLSTDGNQVYGTGYGYLVNNNPNTNANLENAFAATAAGGNLVWVSGCRGDTYSSAPLAGALYMVGHPHDCSPIGAWPQTNPWTFQRASAYATAPPADGRLNHGGSFDGRPAPELLHWLPTLDAGTYTGQSQAAWTVAGNSSYAVLGGEFPKVNGTAQQGLVRFAVRGLAPNKQGPQGGTQLTPALTSLAPGTVRVAWTAAWDRDNRRLTYEVLRGATTSGSTVLSTRTLDTAWWDRPPMAFTDRTAPPGTSQTYRIRVRDALGNVVAGNPATTTVPAGTLTASPYSDAVVADGATSQWRLGEGSGTVGYDWVSGNDLTLASDVQHGQPGALSGDPGTATAFTGSDTVAATTGAQQSGPQTFSVEAWIKTTTTSGGKIIGFGDSTTGSSGSYDRHLYLTNAGKLVFGVYNNGVYTVASGASYNDGAWHHVVGTLGIDGQTLYVDGKKAGGRTDSHAAQSFSGYWRIGGDNLNGWPDQPSSSSFAGTLDEVAVYPTALTLDQVRSHYQAAGGTVVVPQRPADTYGQAVWDANPDLYLRLDETSGTSAVNTMTAGPGATYSAGVTLGQPAAPAAPGGTAITFPGGGPQTVVATQVTSNPQVFSLETWFKTTTTSGGRIIGFGNAATGNSSNYDRHLYMLDGGQLLYGIWTGQTSTIQSPAAYNDGAWHHVVVTQGTDGQHLYVDGALVASGAATTPQSYDGYWRLGTDNTWGGASSNDFAGSLDEAAVYPAVLSASTISSHYQLGVPAANKPPVAAFTPAATNLAATFDGSASADPDGTVASYAWTFGDGATGTGVTAAHTYPAAGPYTVTLTVTDDKGATGSVSHLVTVSAANQPPVAAFTPACTGLACSFDASASADADGTVASYAWTFGDGATGTGATANHTYTVAGTFAVALTVTDDQGATGTASHSVTVSGAGAVLASDTFSRTTTTGWGSADAGGAWTITGSASGFSVGGGTGNVRLASAGAGQTATIIPVSSSATDMTVSLTTDKPATGGGIFLTAIGRRTAGGEYHARVKLYAGNTVVIGFSRVTGGTETVIGNELVVPGLTYTPGMVLKVRQQVEGAGTTNLRLKVWAASSAEPAAWQVTRTDTTSGLQGPGAIGLIAYLSGSATNAPVVISFDDLVATSL